MSDDGSDASGAGAVTLAHRDLGGEGRPLLVVLHGLLGSSRNWITAGRELADRFHVIALDLRNHGDSPHTADMRFDDMVADVVAWLDTRGEERVRLMGHSLGGKVAMRLACRVPSRVERLFVLDIAPRAYPKGNPVLEAMVRVDPASFNSRRDVDRALAESIPDAPTRSFVLTNLAKDRDGGLTWRCGLDGLYANIDSMRDSPLGASERYTGPTIFIVGEHSAYFSDEDRSVVREHFPAARIETLPGAGHNVHFDAREAFVETVFEFDASDEA